jgi:8-oxo-dGTP pyrophosphatase MutT (NUDIX family)
MREIQRTIVSAIIFSKDGKVLMGRKDSNGGGVYADCWHIPGGGIDEGETLEDAVIREVKEEVGIDLTMQQLQRIPGTGSGTSEKTLKDTGEKVLCHMEFNRFEVHINDFAENIVMSLDDDLEEVKWFTRAELQNVQQIPGGREFFQEMGYMD